MEDVFTSIAKSNGWGGRQSLSGSGSDIEETKAVIQALPKLFKKYKIETLTDIPCGDFNWMRFVDLDGIDYLGIDIVGFIIESNQEKYPDYTFRQGTVMQQHRNSDLVLCRDLLGHFSNKDVDEALNFIIDSGSKYLLTTTFPDAIINKDIVTGSWRPINVELLLGKPIELIKEDHEGKYLGLWDLREVESRKKD